MRSHLQVHLSIFTVILLHVPDIKRKTRTHKKEEFMNYFFLTVSCEKMTYQCLKIINLL